MLLRLLELEGNALILYLITASEISCQLMVKIYIAKYSTVSRKEIGLNVALAV